MGFSGDIGKLGQLARNLRKLSEVPSQVADDVADDIADLIAEEFDAGADPYGNAWAPLAAATLAKHGPPPLSDSGSGAGTVSVTPSSGAGISITLADYFGFHQGGFTHRGGKEVPARPVLPSGAFPARWSEAIRAATEARIRSTLGK